MVRKVILSCLFLITGYGKICCQVVTGSSIISPPANPATITTTTPVDFKAEYEIVLLPDPDGEVITNDNGFSATGTVDFHGYIVPAATYAKMKSTLDGSYFVTIDNSLSFSFEEKFQGGNLNYKIFNYKREAISSLPVLTSVYGHNYFTISLGSILPSPVRSDQADSFYILEVLDSKGDKSVLRFQYVPVN